MDKMVDMEVRIIPDTTCVNSASAIINSENYVYARDRKEWLDKACNWLKRNAIEYWLEVHEDCHITYSLDTEQLVKNFKKAMEK